MQEKRGDISRPAFLLPGWPSRSRRLAEEEEVFLFLVVVVAGEPKSGVQEEEANLLATEEEEKSCRRKKGRFREGPFRKGLGDSIGDWPLPYLFWLDGESVALWAGKTAINNSYSVAAAKDIVAIVLRKKQVCRTVKIISAKNWVQSSCRNFKSAKRKKSFQQIQKKGIKSEHLGCTSPPPAHTHNLESAKLVLERTRTERRKDREKPPVCVVLSFLFPLQPRDRASSSSNTHTNLKQYSREGTPNSRNSRKVQKLHRWCVAHGHTDEGTGRTNGVSRGGDCCWKDLA